MPTIRDEFRSPFVLDRKVLTDLVRDLTVAFVDHNRPPAKLTVVIQAAGQHAEELRDIPLGNGAIPFNIDKLFDLHNRRDSPIEMLAMTIRGGASRNPLYCEVIFGSRGNYSIVYHVISQNDAWAKDAAEKIRSHVRRTMYRGRIYHGMVTLSSFGRFAMAAVVASAVAAAFVLAFAGTRILTHTGNPSSRTMWLSDKDVSDLAEMVTGMEKARGMSMAELSLQITSRQLANMKRFGNQSDLIPMISETAAAVRFWSVFIPLLAIICALTYLALYCYPRASFAWGDCERKYEEVAKMRSFVWTSIVLAIILGISLNLASFGITTPPRPAATATPAVAAPTTVK